MLTPLKLVMTGVVVFIIGVAFGAFDIDPLSAWIGTAGMAIAAVALLWLLVARLRARPDA